MNITVTSSNASPLDLSDRRTVVEATKTAQLSQGRGSPLSGAEAPVDSISLSGMASPRSSQHEARLLAIKEVIDSGSYSVSASKVAEAMLQKGFQEEPSNTIS